MFNLKSDLNIYTCDKYLLAQTILKRASRQGSGDMARYSFAVTARIVNTKDRYDNITDLIRFSPEGLNAGHFREFLELAGIQMYSLEDIRTFNQWSKANPSKNWQDFVNGVSVNLSLPAAKLDDAFTKIRPDKLMNDLALSPESRVAGLIGKSKSSRYSRRRTSKDDRENKLVRLWALFGSEVAISADGKTLDSVLNGIQLHDFGINHCENMQAILAFVESDVRARDEESAVAAAIRTLDEMIAKFGGKPITRSRPRSPYFRQIYDILNVKAA